MFFFSSQNHGSEKWLPSNSYLSNHSNCSLPMGETCHLADSRVGLLGRKSVDTRHDSTLKGWHGENTVVRNEVVFSLFFGGGLGFTVGAVYIYIMYCISMLFL